MVGPETPEVDNMAMSVKYKYGEIRFSNFRIKGFSEITSCVDLN